MSDQTPLTNWQSIGALSQDAVKKAARKQLELQAGLTEAQTSGVQGMAFTEDNAAKGGVQ